MLLWKEGDGDDYTNNINNKNNKTQKNDNKEKTATAEKKNT